jgi:hypothetical protein
MLTNPRAMVWSCSASHSGPRAAERAPHAMSSADRATCSGSWPALTKHCKLVSELFFQVASFCSHTHSRGSVNLFSSLSCRAS